MRSLLDCNPGSRSRETQLKAHSVNVCITHPAHRLRGQSFPIIQRQKQKNPDVVEIQLTDGERRFIPLEWTDKKPEVVTLPGARFLLNNLLLVRKQVDDFLQQSQKTGTLSPKDNQNKGGSNELSKSAHVGDTNRSTTKTSSRYSGADVATPIREKRKGGE